MKKIYWNKFPLFAKWYITSKCNLRCTHCYLTDYTKQPNHKNALKIADYLISKKIFGVIFLGGEPLLRSDFCEIVERLAQNGIGCTVSTNGTIVSKEYAERLKVAGINDCQVSFEGVDAFTNDLIRGRGSFDKAVQGVRYLIASGIKVTMGFTLTSKNYCDLARMIDFSKSLKASTVRFEIFIPVGTGEKNANDLKLSKKQIEMLKQQLSLYSNRYSELGIIVQHPYLNTATCSSKCTTGCGAGTTNIIINSDNSISACDILNEQDRTKYCFNSPEEIEEIWENDVLFKKWRGKESKSEFGDFTNVHQSNCHVANMLYGHEVV